MINDVHSFTTTEKIRSVFGLFVLAIAFLTGGILAAVFGLLTLFSFTNFVVTTFGKAMGGIAFKILGLHLNIVYHGEHPKNIQAVYIFNHSSTLDIPITLAIGLKNTRYVAKYELLFNPVFAIVGLATGQVFVNRGTSQKAIQSLKKA
jgi:1-acyl-sn-glycerol-3-phosphate acyltransferase